MTTDRFAHETRIRPDFERRMAAARQRALYELGDASWAGIIVGAFLDPDADRAALREEQG